MEAKRIAQLCVDIPIKLITIFHYLIGSNPSLRLGVEPRVRAFPRHKSFVVDEEPIGVRVVVDYEMDLRHFISFRRLLGNLPTFIITGIDRERKSKFLSRKLHGKNLQIKKKKAPHFCGAIF
jgi:hypothetical protein